ncbi:MAG TPA: fibronectin type III domain-containing protein [Ohtaekwangia sp.]|nr:fibronectin type III domain-containing protein [Ohtaekwangia sp.]
MACKYFTDRKSPWINLFKLLMVMFFFFIVHRTHAQIYPVQVTTQLIPPYSVYLSDYASAGNEKLRVIMIHRDLTQPAYQLRLMLRVEWNGKVIMQTSRAFNPPPLSLNPGIPTVISGADLFPYLESRNIDFVGYSREQYERTRALPEGNYRISFTAYDYRRQDVQVSNEGNSFYYLAKNEPPLINFPACGSKAPIRMPQQIIFSWMPRNTASPNSAMETEYEFSLYETRPEGRNPNDIVMSTQPVFKTRTSFTQLVYGPAEPMLLENMRYVWRVQAIDLRGRDAFRNNGYSEVCTFTYGGIDAAYDIGRVQNLQAESETERKAKIWWNASDYDEYRVYYKKTSGGYEWATADVTNTEYKLFDLEPDTEYETRVQAMKRGVSGPYSDIVKFRTTPRRIIQCGTNEALFTVDQSKPLETALIGGIIDVDGMEVFLIDVTSLGSGWYKGMGTVTTKLLGASFNVTFERLFIDENHVAGAGRIDFLTNGVAKLQYEQIQEKKDQQKEKVQSENRGQWAETVFYDEIFLFSNTDIENITVDNQSYITITNSDGNATANAEVMQVLVSVPEEAIIIEDKNGDQWVVQKDADTGQTKVTKVAGGGLSPTSNIPINADDLVIVKKALKLLRKEYDEQLFEDKSSQRLATKATVDAYIDLRHQSMLATDLSNDGKEPYYVEMIENTEIVAQGQNEFEERSKQYKFAEREYNKVVIIKSFAGENRKAEELKVIASGLIINDKTFTVYVSESRSNGITEDQLVDETKSAIVQLIDKILNEYVYEIK